ncbi:hypothetical protein [Microbacterium sp. GCS4]|uniref:hypothetical protein n=1 Tax=Microbacterium sp. GCS4 TaxID=1692239 RepID=UPI00067FA0E9|nr:hypothetical protein [Microbacterium sp. GCS4]KNY05231.1 hypothetical protein AKH00_12700 [Microbacterium sp. GCS4]
MTTHPALELVDPGLYATTTPVPLPFMAGVDLRAFVLDADEGPVLVYNNPGIDPAADGIHSLGRPTRLLINHWHEGMHGSPALDVPVAVHERDRRQTERGMRVDESLTGGRQRLGDDLEVIPSFAHTPGAAFYLWDSGHHRYLFPGDSIWVEDGVWQAVILGESDRRAFVETLELMRDLDFDVLVPWPAQTGAPVLERVSAEQKERQIASLLGRIRAEGARGR